MGQSLSLEFLWRLNTERQGREGSPDRIAPGTVQTVSLCNEGERIVIRNDVIAMLYSLAIPACRTLEVAGGEGSPDGMGSQAWP